MTEWISVKDKLPKDGNLWSCNSKSTITHWMPLTKPIGDQ